MKTVKHIMQGLPSQLFGDADVLIQSMQSDSRLVNKGDLFVATKGIANDGHNFIPTAIERGAVAIVCEKLPVQPASHITWIQVQNAQEYLGPMAANFFDHPSTKLKLVGITGTNGKTTCATLSFQLFTALGYTCGLLSTVQNQIADRVLESTHTTPDALRLQQLLHDMLAAGCTHVFMEVSSHAIHQHRIAGVQFAGGCFTNITHDHLDYHQTFDEYIRVKKSFFDHLPSEAFALTNVDDKRGMVMLQNTSAKKRSYSLQTLADYKGKIIENNLTGLHVIFNGMEMICSMIGEFNAYNLLCVFGIALELKEDKQRVMEILSALQGAAGRFDYQVSAKQQVLGIVDYAHTPDALLNVLATINKLRRGNETLFTIIGCGGDRDKTKRPLMARVASEHSDRVVFTSDNPRSENPSQILQDMEEGVPVHQRKKCIRIEDRKEAIKTVCSMVNAGDIILLAGKGHERYQEIQGVKIEFDDKKVLQNMLELYEK
jgi:UDP-N-acetylmuramoyl-L-alanyl-D-glutamate--2,6-diaminopimelate ligase